MADQPDNIWNHKPWWCQPWSILLTGIGLILGSWLGLHRWWITLLVSVPVLTWMGYFLLLYPKQMMAAGPAATSLEVTSDDASPDPRDP